MFVHWVTQADGNTTRYEREDQPAISARWHNCICGVAVNLVTNPRGRCWKCDLSGAGQFPEENPDTPVIYSGLPKKLKGKTDGDR